MIREHFSDLVQITESAEEVAHDVFDGAAKLLTTDILQRMKLLNNTFLVADEFNAILAGANNVRCPTTSGRS
jgi:hypothetical protein